MSLQTLLSDHVHIFEISIAISVFDSDNHSEMLPV
jgi:hypothetical protein